MKNSRRLFTLVVACGFSLCLGISAIAETKPATHPTTNPATQPVESTAELLAVRISKPVPPDMARAIQGARRFQNNQWTDGEVGGVEVVFAIRVPSRKILHVFPAHPDTENPFRIDTFLDDKQNNLMRTRPDSRRLSSSYSSATEDGTAIVLSASTDRVPGEGATRVFIKGNVNVRTSTPDKTSDRQKLSMRVGREIAKGPIPLTVRAMADRKPMLAVTFSGVGSLERIKSLQFFDVDGNPIAASLGGRSENQAPNESSIVYHFPKLVDEVQVEVTYVDPIETVTIPVDIQADLPSLSIGKAVTSIAPAPKAAQNQPDRQPIDENQAAAPRRAPIIFPQTRPVFRSAVLSATRPASTNPSPADNSKPQGTVENGPPMGDVNTLASIKILGVNVSKAPAEDMGRHWPFRPELFFQPNGGTLIRAMMTAKEGQAILDVDSESLRIDRFADDTGAELSPRLAQPDPRRRTNSAFSLHTISDNQHNALFHVPLAAVPTADATRLAVRGSIRVRLGTSQKTTEIKDWPVRIGSSAPVGDATIRIASIGGGTPSIASGNRPVYHLQLLLMCTKPAELIRSIELWDAEGRPVRVNLPPTQPEPRPNRQEGYPLHVELDRDVERATVKITYYDRIEPVTIPLDLVTGIGL